MIFQNHQPPESNCAILLFFYQSTLMVRIRLPRRNFCIRLRHNALSALEVFKIKFHRRRFRRYAAAAVILTRDHPAWLPLFALSIRNRMRVRRLENKVWVNPIPLTRRRNLFIDEWADEILYQDFGFEKIQLHAICVVSLLIFYYYVVPFSLFSSWIGLANSSPLVFASP